MPISEPGFTSTPIEQFPSLVLEIVTSRPEENVNLATPVLPGQMVGYYNPSLGYVELFVGNHNGTRWIGVS